MWNDWTVLAPEFTEPLQDMVTVDGPEVTMKCRAIGVPKPQIKWERNWMRSSTELTGRHYITLDSGDLKIKSVLLYLPFGRSLI